MSEKNVLRMNLSPILAKQVIHQILADSGNVFFTVHAEQRMEERNITRTQVMCCLRNGDFIEEPYRGIKGNWEMKLEVITAGDRIQIAAALDHDENGNQIVVITVLNT